MVFNVGQLTAGNWQLKEPLSESSYLLKPNIESGLLSYMSIYYSIAGNVIITYKYISRIISLIKGSLINVYFKKSQPD